MTFDELRTIPALPVIVCQICGQTAEVAPAEVIMKDGVLKGVVLPTRCGLHGVVYALPAILGGPIGAEPAAV